METEMNSHGPHPNAIPPRQTPVTSGPYATKLGGSVTSRARRAKALASREVRNLWDQAGKIKPMVLLWAIGIPLPIVIIIALVRGC